MNYICRRLATINGSAEWTWDIIVQSADTSPVAARIGSDADILAATTTAERPGPGRFALTGVVRNIVAVSNASNAANLAQGALATPPVPYGGAGAKKEDASEGVVPADPPSPALPPVSALALKDADTIKRLAAAGPAADNRILASLWRHLKMERGLVPALAPLLCYALSSPSFRDGFAVIRARAMEVADAIPRVAPRWIAFDQDAVFSGVEGFSRRIAELTRAGRVVACWARKGENFV